MDLTIEVMLPARGGDPTKPGNPKYRLLAPIAVYWPMKQVAVVGMSFTGYIHVTGVPERSALRNKTPEQLGQWLNNRLCKVWNEELFVGNEPITQRRERRIWRFIAENIPAGARNTLFTERQITVTWTQLKNFLEHLVELRTLTDTDLD